MALLPLGGAVINLCYDTDSYKGEMYKDIPQDIIDGNNTTFYFLPAKYTYIMGQMKEFTLEFVAGFLFASDVVGKIILQDNVSNDLLKLVFYRNDKHTGVYDIYLGDTKLNNIELRPHCLLSIIYKNNKLYGYYNSKEGDYKIANRTEIFSVDTNLQPYKIEFNHEHAGYAYDLTLLRISHKADDLYYAK